MQICIVFNSNYPISDLYKIRPSNTGFCYIYLLEWDSISYFPSVNSMTGVINERILSPLVWKKIDFTGGMKYTDKVMSGGDYTVTELSGVFRASDPKMMLNTNKLRERRWMIAAQEKNDLLWLIGDENSGAKLTRTYDIGIEGKELGLMFTWDNETGPYLYQPLPISGNDFEHEDFSKNDFL